MSLSVKESFFLCDCFSIRRFNMRFLIPVTEIITEISDILLSQRKNKSPCFQLNIGFFIWWSIGDSNP